MTRATSATSPRDEAEGILQQASWRQAPSRSAGARHRSTNADTITEHPAAHDRARGARSDWRAARLHESSCSRSPVVGAGTTTGAPPRLRRKGHATAMRAGYRSTCLCALSACRRWHLPAGVPEGAGLWGAAAITGWQPFAAAACPGMAVPGSTCHEIAPMRGRDDGRRRDRARRRGSSAEAGRKPMPTRSRRRLLRRGPHHRDKPRTYLGQVPGAGIAARLGVVDRLGPAHSGGTVGSSSAATEVLGGNSTTRAVWRRGHENAAGNLGAHCDGADRISDLTRPQAPSGFLENACATQPRYRVSDPSPFDSVIGRTRSSASRVDRRSTPYVVRDQKSRAESRSRRTRYNFDFPSTLTSRDRSSVTGRSITRPQLDGDARRGGRCGTQLMIRGNLGPACRHRHLVDVHDQPLDGTNILNVRSATTNLTGGRQSGTAWASSSCPTSWRPRPVSARCLRTTREFGVLVKPAPPRCSTRCRAERRRTASGRGSGRSSRPGRGIPRGEVLVLSPG